MKFKFIIIVLFGFIFSSCVGVSSKGIFGTGVSVALDPRTVGTQMDDSIMQKNLTARILIKDKKYLLSIKSKVLDGRISRLKKSLILNNLQKICLLLLSLEPL